MMEMSYVSYRESLTPLSQSRALRRWQNYSAKGTSTSIIYLCNISVAPSEPTPPTLFVLEQRLEELAELLQQYEDGFVEP